MCVYIFTNTTWMNRMQQCSNLYLCQAECKLILISLTHDSLAWELIHLAPCLWFSVNSFSNNKKFVSLRDIHILPFPSLVFTNDKVCGTCSHWARMYLCVVFLAFILRAPFFPVLLISEFFLPFLVRLFYILNPFRLFYTCSPFRMFSSHNNLK